MKKKAGAFLALILALAVMMTVSSVLAFADSTTDPESKLPEAGFEIDGDKSDDGYIYTVTEPDEEHLGDVNGDGEVNIKDATVIQKHMIQIAPIKAEFINRADIDGNGLIRTADVTLLQKKLVHLA